MPKTRTAAGVPVETLGHEDGMLPSFMLPPADLSQPGIAFGSCRSPDNDHPDAMVWIDDLLRDNATEFGAARRRGMGLGLHQRTLIVIAAPQHRDMLERALQRSE